MVVNTAEPKAQIKLAFLIYKELYYIRIHFFTVNFGDKLEDIIKKENKNHPNFSVKITNSGSENFNQIWSQKVNMDFKTA